MDILQYIGYSPEESDSYCRLVEKMGAKVWPLADAYFAGTYQHISQLYEPLCQLTDNEPDLVGAMLLVVVRCAEQRAQALSGREQELFLGSLQDIAAKTRECVAYKNAFGIFVLNWYDGLIKNWRLQLGRLQYEVGVHSGPDITVGDFTLRQGDKKLQCHIPSGMGALTLENCMDSIHRAWETFPEYRKMGYLPVLCHSWLFYPQYAQVFGENSGVGIFRGLWHYYSVGQQENFNDCWRVFSMDMPENLDLLPRNTRMQRAFAEYIADGGTFGDACGILLYDGKTLIHS